MPIQIVLPHSFHSKLFTVILLVVINFYHVFQLVLHSFFQSISTLKLSTTPSWSDYGRYMLQLNYRPCSYYTVIKTYFERKIAPSVSKLIQLYSCSQWHYVNVDTKLTLFCLCIYRISFACCSFTTAFTWRMPLCWEVSGPVSDGTSLSAS